MDSIKIYSADGALLIDAALESSSAQDWGIMSENQVSLDFYTEECIILPASCYIEFEGQRFWLFEEYKPTENNSAEWGYQVRFLGAESLLSVTVVLNATNNLDEPIFNLTAPASQHLDFIVKNLNRRFPGMNWRAGSVPETENIHIEYVGTYASDALQTIVGDKYEWWVDDFVINVGRCEFGEFVGLGYENGLLGGITYSTANEMRSYAYLYPIGSTRNIDPSKYGYPRLQLPDGITRIDINPEQGLAELVESDAFADIFPRYVGTVTAVRTSSGKNEDGTSFTIYHIKDSHIPFDPNDYEIAGEVKHITFQSGELMGAEFEVNYDATYKEFEIITQFQDGGLSQLPGGTLIPKVGDKYVVWGISMPDEYYPLAEQEFLQAALTFVSESIKEASVYRATVDFIEVQRRGLRLRPGQRVRLFSTEYFPGKGYYDSRITRITRDLCYPDEVTIEVSSVVSKGTISRLRNSINDSAIKVASLGQSLKNYVDITSAQNIFGTKNFANGFTLAGIKMYKHPDGYVYLDSPLVLQGGLTMYGDDGTTVPSIFDALPIDGETIKRNANKELYVNIDGSTIKRDGNGALYVDETVLSVSGGGGGVADSVHWGNVIGKPSWIGSTKPSYKYSEVEERPDLSVYFLASNFTKANIKSTLGISDWALASVKPTYKYSEIGNTPDLSVYALNTDLAKKWTQNDAKIANWDYAYGWGNHAAAGYAKASDVTNEFKNYVKLAGDSQSITAQHNFTNGLKIDGISLRKVDNYLYLDSSLVLSGGFTMYGDDGTTVKPIWESIPFDRTTIDWVDGKWTVVGGVGSGGISEEFLNVKLQEYQPLLSTSNKLPYSLISGTPDLSVYALKTSIPTKLSQLTDDVVAGNYLPIKGGTINSNEYVPLTVLNKNLSEVWVGFEDSVGTSYIGSSQGVPSIYLGTGSNKAILHIGNYSTYALPLTGGTITGALTLGGTTSETAAIKFSRSGDNTWNYIIWPGSTSSDCKLAFGYETSAQGSFYYMTSNAFYPRVTYRHSLGTSDFKWSNVYAATFTGNLVGNADSATKLAAPRTIWGQEFDGTDNVSGVLTTSEDISFNTEKYNDVSWSRGFIWRNDNLEYGNMCYVNIRGQQYINIAHGAYNSILGLRILADGNVAIGGLIADAKLHVHGTARFTGDTTFSSKVIVGTIPVYESVDGTLYVDANVVFRGGVAMYGNTTTKVNEE